MTKFLNSDGLSRLVALIKQALGGKQDTLVSGTNIKTVNSNSILGSGNINLKANNILMADDDPNGSWADGDPVEEVLESLSGAIDDKQNTLVSGTNIKTINNTSLLGSGNIAVQPALTFDNAPTASSSNPVKSGGVKTALDAKQDTLVSGTSIKTVNNNSLLGSGNVSIKEVSSIAASESQLSGGTNTVTINYSDGTSSSFNVRNGVDGVSLGQAGLVDDMVTGGHSDALAAEQGKILGGSLYVTETYDQSNLTKGKVWENTVTTIPSTMSTNASVGCMVLKVREGDKVTVQSQANAYHCTTWCIAGTDRKKISAAEKVDDAISVTLNIEQDGYVFLNCADTYYASFSASRTFINAKELTEEVNDLKDDYEETKEDVLGIKHYVADDMTPASSSATGQYYNLSGGVGTTAPDTATTYTGSGFKCMMFPVVAGQTITVSTVGVSNARAYALTDANRKILTVAAASTNTTSSPVTLEVEEKGYFYVNLSYASASVNLTKFYVDVTIDVPEALGEVSNYVVDKCQDAMYAPHYKNNPLPLYKDTLKVLAIGNSYTEDPTTYLNDLVEGANIDASKLCVYMAYQSSASLQTWIDNYENSTSKEITRMAGGITMAVTSGTVAQLLAQDWDVVVLQQLSTYSNDYLTFNPNLTKMIGYIRKNCTNEKVAIAWQSVWAYKEGYNSMPASATRWAQICKATKEMSHRDGIDIIIPTGTAIQNARAYALANSSFNTGNTGEITRDGTHLEFGVGRYIAACTWFQTLITPMFGIGVLGNPAVHTVTTTEENATQNVYGAVSVDSTNKTICQLCAFAATINKWEVTDVTNESITDYDPTYAPTIYDRVDTLEENTRKLTAADLAGTSDWIKAKLTSAGWLLGKYIKSDGTAVNGTDYCVTPYIQIGDLSNHILEIRFGFANVNCCISLYTSSGSKVTYYGATSNPGTVTLGSVSTATQLRVTFNINDIPNCYIYDKTADEYIIKGNDVITDILKNNLVDYKLFKDTLVVQNSGNSDRTVMSQKAVGEAIEDAPLRKMRFNNYAVFGAYTNKTCTSVDTYNIDELKVITSLRVVDTFGANNPSYYNHGLGHILGIVRASSPTTDYLSLYGDGYKLYLWFKKNGTDVLKYSLGNSNGRKILRTFARIDLYGKTISLYSKGGDGTYLTLVENYDISALDLSNLQEVKIVTSVGTSHNDKMLFNHVQVNNYIINPKTELDTVVNYGEYSTKSSHKIATKSPTPSTLMFTNDGGQTGITATLNEPLHKIITVDRDTAGLVYNFGFYLFSKSPSHMQTYAYEIYKVKFTNVTSNLLTRGWSENSMGSSYILNPETYAYTKIPMDGNTGTVLEYEIEEGKTYFFLYVIGSGYHTRYNHYLGGHFTMEITEPTTYCVGSMNLCGEYYDGQYFCGHIPFKSGENFIPSVYGQFNDTYNLPAMKGRMRLSGNNVQIYNGTTWKQINNS